MQPKMDNQANSMPQSPHSVPPPQSPSAQAPPTQQPSQMPPPTLPPPGPNQEQFRLASPSPNSVNQNFFSQNFQEQTPQPPPQQMPLNPINNFNSQYSKPQPHYNTPRACAGCNTPIRDRHLLECLNLFWHVQCLKCQACSCILSDLGEKCFTRDRMILCRDDYFKIYGSQCISGKCESCTKPIHANEQVMRVMSNRVYHVDCFACQTCRTRLKPGDKFCYHNNRIFCEKDNPIMMMNQNQVGPGMLNPGMNTSPPTGTKRTNGSNSKRSKSSNKNALAQQQQQQMMHQQQMMSQQQQQFNMQHQQQMMNQQQMQQQHLMYQEHEKLQQQIQMQQQIIN